MRHLSVEQAKARDHTNLKKNIIYIYLKIILSNYSQQKVNIYMLYQYFLYLNINKTIYHTRNLCSIAFCNRKNKLYFMDIVVQTSKIV